MMRRFALVAAVLVAAAPAAQATPVNTNNLATYNLFAAGATIETFETVVGLTPFALSSYANATNSSTALPATAQLGGQITGLHFHSGGGSFNNPVGNPGTPTALLELEGAIAGDAHSASNVVGSLEINTENLDIDNFIEIIFTGALQNRAGVWLNPSLGAVTFSAFDSSGNQLESFVGNAGNFVGVERLTNDIKFLSIVSAAQNVGFTADDLTFGRLGATVAEPATLTLLLAGLFGGAAVRRTTRRIRG